ncbi:MAG: PBECR2 nuclease fold domain-containing protein [Bacillota bacterium]|nr:PBECR2 nuclease fold domain-containing protein [Bacillota bacterium]
MVDCTDKPRIVGKIDQRIIDLLELSIPVDTPIFLGKTNIDHMHKEHPEDYKKYFSELGNIIASPDYVTKHPKKDSIEYIKVFDGYVLVAVRISNKGKLFAKTIFKMSNEKIEKYQKKNVLKKY